MAEDNNEMEVENILSSIKDILEEDETSAKEIPAATPDVAEVAVEPVIGEDSDKDGDIIELSDDMRISSDEPDAEVVSEDELSAESPLGAAIDEMDREDEESKAPVSDFIETSVSENFAKEDNNNEVSANYENIQFEEQPLETTAPLEEATLPSAGETVDFNVDSGDIIELAPPPANEPMELSPFEDTVAPVVEEAIAPVAEEAAPQEVSNAQAEIDALFEDAGVKPAEPVVEESAPALPEDDSSKETVVEESKDDNEETVDVSAGIISNFAKIFAKDKNMQNGVQEADKPVEIGDKDKTLEGFVKDAIVKVIGDDIAKAWNDGADYRTFAESEIKRQTAQWVSDNLSQMVEKIVKAEIERVMAKVGSQG